MATQATDSQHEIMLSWLRDAHAMEKAAEQILARQESRVKTYPKVLAKVQEHLEVTKQQALRLEGLLDRMDGGASTTKDMISQIMGNMQAMANAGSSDEIIKNGISDYVFEQFEIASYRSLIQAAEQLGESEVKRVCEQNLREEEEMADWLRVNLPDVTSEFLKRQMTGQQFKR